VLNSNSSMSAADNELRQAAGGDVRTGGHRVDARSLARFGP